MKTCKGLPERIIIAMSDDKEIYSARLSKISGSNQAHILKVLSNLKKEGIVQDSENVKNNRTKLLELTNKGKEIRILLIKLKSLTNGN